MPQYPLIRLESHVQLGNTKIAKAGKKNLETVVLKVVPVKTTTRTSEALRHCVGVAVGNQEDHIGTGEKYGVSEQEAVRAAEKAALRNRRKIRLFEDRTVHGRVTGRSGGDCISLSEAPKALELLVLV